MDANDLVNRFRYHTPDSEDKKELHGWVRTECSDFAQALNVNLPDGREKSLAVTHLEEVMFWANAAIARNK